MMQYYGYSLTDLENMYPYERDIYIGMINKDNEIQQQKKSNLG